MSYSLPDLPYDYGALEPHYEGRVLELERPAEARASERFDSIVGLEKTLAFNLPGHVPHSHFWTNLSPQGGGEPDGELRHAIEHCFGSFASFRRQLSQATITVRGSGLALSTGAACVLPPVPEPAGGLRRESLEDPALAHRSGTFRAGPGTNRGRGDQC